MNSLEKAFTHSLLLLARVYFLTEMKKEINSEDDIMEEIRKFLLENIALTSIPSCRPYDPYYPITSKKYTISCDTK